MEVGVGLPQLAGSRALAGKAGPPSPPSGADVLGRCTEAAETRKGGLPLAKFADAHRPAAGKLPHLSARANTPSLAWDGMRERGPPAAWGEAVERRGAEARGLLGAGGAGRAGARQPAVHAEPAARLAGRGTRASPRFPPSPAQPSPARPAQPGARPGDAARACTGRVGLDAGAVLDADAGGLGAGRLGFDAWAAELAGGGGRRGADRGVAAGAGLQQTIRAEPAAGWTSEAGSHVDSEKVRGPGLWGCSPGRAGSPRQVEEGLRGLASGHREPGTWAWAGSQLDPAAHGAQQGGTGPPAECRTRGWLEGGGGACPPPCVDGAGRQGGRGPEEREVRQPQPPAGGRREAEGVLAYMAGRRWVGVRELQVEDDAGAGWAGGGTEAGGGRGGCGPEEAWRPRAGTGADSPLLAEGRPAGCCMADDPRQAKTGVRHGTLYSKTGVVRLSNPIRCMAHDPLRDSLLEPPPPPKQPRPRPRAPTPCSPPSDPRSPLASQPGTGSSLPSPHEPRYDPPGPCSAGAKGRPWGGFPRAAGRAQPAHSPRSAAQRSLDPPSPGPAPRLDPGPQSPAAAMGPAAGGSRASAGSKLGPGRAACDAPTTRTALALHDARARAGSALARPEGGAVDAHAVAAHAAAAWGAGSPRGQIRLHVAPEVARALLFSESFEG